MVVRECAFTAYCAISKLNLIGHLYDDYARILATNLASNDTCLQETLNPDKPLEMLYIRLN